MRQRLKLSIIIPVYNESESILATLDEIKKKIKTTHEIIIIYDQDKDSTLKALKNIKINENYIKVIKNTIHPGPSGAIRTGIISSKHQLILVTMSDLSDDLSQVDSMIKILGNKEGLVSPSRYSNYGYTDDLHSLKAFLSRLTGRTLNKISGINTYDPTNSFKLYSKNILKKMNLISTSSFSVTLEITVKCHLLNCAIIDIPTIWKKRKKGSSNFKLFESILSYSPWFILCLSKNRLFNISKIFNKII